MVINNKENNWEIDVPVAINFFARPDTFKQVFKVIKEVKPRQLFLIADGPRNNVPSDIEKCNECRMIAEDIDWNCDVYHFYNEKNKGLFHTYFDCMTEVFKVVDRCVFLEDDLVVSKSFFRYCKELLEKYENDLRIHFITGMNLMGKYDAPDGDYFFSGEGAIWGYALWKRTFESMTLSFRKNEYAIEMTKWVAKQIKPGYEKKIAACVENPEWQGHIPHVEFYKNFLRFSQNQIYIVPKYNMVSNIGASSNAVHAADDIRKLPRTTQKLFNSKIYEMTFPLKAPEFMIRDLYYEKQVNYMLAWNRPVLKYMRRIEALFRHLRYGDFKRVISKGGGISQGRVKGVKRGNMVEIQTKLISIIIPVYNVENFISRCLDSLCNQTYPNFEVIMIDDGSTDNSYSIAKCYCEKDKRFKLFHQENSGQGSARNNGIKKAQGDYLAFVDSDDWVHPEFLEKMLCCAIANEADIVMCGVERVWENGIRRRNPISNQKEYIVDNKKEFLLHASFSSVDKIYRKDLLKGIEFAEKIKFEDFVFTPQVLEKASVIVGIPDVLYYYFWNISSTTNKVKINRDILKAHKKLEKTDFARNNPEIMSAYFVRMVIGSLIWALLHDYKNIKEVKSIMQYGKDIHNDLKKYITKENIGSVFWGNLVVHNRFFVAVTYTKLMSFLRNVGRPIYHKVISITKKYL